MVTATSLTTTTPNRSGLVSQGLAGEGTCRLKPMPVLTTHEPVGGGHRRGGRGATTIPAIGSVQRRTGSGHRDGVTGGSLTRGRSCPIAHRRVGDEETDGERSALLVSTPVSRALNGEDGGNDGGGSSTVERASRHTAVQRGVDDGGRRHLTIPISLVTVAVTV